MKEITALNFFAVFRKKNIIKSRRNNASILKSPWGRPTKEFDCCNCIENLDLLINGIPLRRSVGHYFRNMKESGQFCKKYWKLI
jgi:hypothetical protein